MPIPCGMGRGIVAAIYHAELPAHLCEQARYGGSGSPNGPASNGS